MFEHFVDMDHLAAMEAAKCKHQRAQSRNINFGLAYGRGMPLNVQPDPPKLPEPPAKPLQEHFNTKRKFLKE